MRWFRVLVVMTIIASLCIGLGFTPNQAIAADITVGQGIYACSRNGLASAITAAGADGTVTFNCNPATINFTTPDDQIEITQNVTIDGSNSGSPITFDGNDATRFFEVTSGTLTLQHLTLKNGKTDLGALRIHADAAAAITDVTFDSNSAFYGGAIDNDGTLTVTQSIFTSNEADYSGAIDNTGTLTITHSIFDSNDAYYGGAINNFGTLTIAQSTFDTNTATSVGGAIVNSAALTITQSTFTSNGASDGGAIFNRGTLILTIAQSTFDSNTATHFGGAIYNNGGKITITQSGFSTNSAEGNGGAIENDGDLTIRRSSFVNNHSDNIGGAIDSWYGPTTIIASTLTGNTADAISEEGTGSSIYISEFAGKVRIIGSTIVQPENTSPALYIANNDSLTLGGVILGGDGPHCEFIANGDLTDSSTLSNDASCNLQGTGSRQNVANLGLGPLTTATINGVEQTYYPLLQGSPAIDGSYTSACPSPDPNENLDQLGTPRPQSISCDIGAIESSYTGAQILCANTWNGALHYASPATAAPPPS